MKKISITIALLMLAAPALADKDYRPTPNETYTPEQYCYWQNRELPTPYQYVCMGRKMPVPKNWFDVEKSGYEVDLNSVRTFPENRFGIDAFATIAHTFDNGKRLFFNMGFSCNGNHQFTIFDNPKIPIMTAEKGSVMRKIALIACVAGLNDLPQ